MTKAKVTTKKDVDNPGQTLAEFLNSQLPKYTLVTSGTTYTIGNNGAVTAVGTPVTNDNDFAPKIVQKSKWVSTDFAYNYSSPKVYYKDRFDDDRDDEKDDHDTENDHDMRIPMEKNSSNGFRKMEDNYAIYKETNNVLYLYKVITDHFNNHLQKAYGYNPDPSKKHLDTLENYVSHDCDGLLKGMGIAGIKTDEDTRVDVTNFLTSLYTGSIYNKRIYAGVLTLDMYDSLLNKLVSKGISIDPELLEKVKSTDFASLLYNGEFISLSYYPPLKVILCEGLHQEGLSDSLYGLGILHKELDELLTVIESKRLEADNIILIDGEQFSRSAFESMVESNYNSFISNLKIETLIENKDIADNSVVEDVKLKLM